MIIITKVNWLNPSKVKGSQIKVQQLNVANKRQIYNRDWNSMSKIRKVISGK